MKIDLAFVRPDGTATVDDEDYRFCLGNPLSSGSLYSSSPNLAPWSSSMNLHRAVSHVESLENDDEDRRLLGRAIKQMRLCDELPHVGFPLVNAALWKPARYKILYGGRDSTKSVAVVDYLLLRGAMERVKYICARYILDSIAQSVHGTMEKRIADLGLSKFYQVLKNEIRGKNGTQFTYAGLFTNMDSMKSAYGLTGVFVEEAQSVLDESMRKLLPTVREEGSEIIFAYNPERGDDPVHEMTVNPRKRTLLMPSSYMDNPWLTRDLADQAVYDKERDPQHYAHVWGGGLQVRTDALIFSSRHWRELGEDERDDVEREIEDDPSCVPILGADWGTRDPAVLIMAFLMPGKRLYVAREAYKTGVEIDDLPALFFGDDVIHESPRWENPKDFQGIPEAIDYTIVADSQRSDLISYLKKRGAKMTRAIKGPGSIDRGIMKLKEYDILVNPDCKNTIHEFAHYSHKIDKRTGEVLPDLQDEFNHAMDSLRYAVESVDRGIVPRRRRSRYWKMTKMSNGKRVRDPEASPLGVKPIPQFCPDYADKIGLGVQ